METAANFTFWGEIFQLTVQPRPKHYFPTKAESALKAHVWEMDFSSEFPAASRFGLHIRGL